MNTMAIIFFCMMISINILYAEKCYICDQTGCDRPGATDIKDCSDAELGGTSGKSFVNGAFGKNETDIYTFIQNEYNAFLLTIQVNQTFASWTSLTKWVCYKTKDKRRGCLVMSKGLCAGDKSWLGKITEIGDKITSIMQKAKSVASQMFTGSGASALNDTQKMEISNWIAENYMAKLVNNSNGPQSQLDSCCEGDACNFASMIQKSTTMLIVLILSTVILV